MTYLFVSSTPFVDCLERRTSTVLHFQDCLFDDDEGSHFDSFFNWLIRKKGILCAICVFYERSLFLFFRPKIIKIEAFMIESIKRACRVTRERVFLLFAFSLPFSISQIVWKNRRASALTVTKNWRTAIREGMEIVYFTLATTINFWGVEHNHAKIEKKLFLLSSCGKNSNWMKYWINSYNNNDDEQHHIIMYIFNKHHQSITHHRYPKPILFPPNLVRKSYNKHY